MTARFPRHLNTVNLYYLTVMGTSRAVPFLLKGTTLTFKCQFPHVLSPFDTTAQRPLERLPEIARHEAIDEWIDAAVEIGHEMKSFPHIFQISFVEL